MTDPRLAGLLSGVAIRWSGTETGLYPATSAADTQRLAGLSTDDLPALLDALADPALFVAAHVALTRLTGIIHEAMPGWNGLAVEIGPDGSAAIEPGQRAGLERRWRRWAAGVPHPARLPPAD